MPFTSDTFTVAQIDRTTWELRESLEYVGAREKFVVPAGFPTDLTSVPRFVAWLIPSYGTYTRAAILHDYHCELAHIGAFNRRDADGIFRRVLGELGVPRARRWVMWAAVRAASFMSDATLREWLLWLMIALPALVFVAIPAVVCLVWLAVFWLVEQMFRK